MRLLFVTSNRIGDAVLSTGVLAHLLETHDGIRPTIACGPLPAPLFEAVPNLDRVIALEKRPKAGHWRELWRETIGRKWDIVVDLRGSALPFFLWAGRRIVGGKADPSMHRVESLGRLLGLDRPPTPRLWTNAVHRERAILAIPHPGDPTESPVIALAPAANWLGKQWRPGYFAELARRLTRRDGPFPGARVAVFAAPHERDMVAPVLDSLPEDRRLDLIGDMTLAEVAACLGRCALFVGNDSGLMHMAAAVGTPTLGLFGPSRPEHYAPWGKACAYVTTTRSYDELVGGPDFDPARTDTLMDSLSVTMVERAVIDLLDRIGER